MPKDTRRTLLIEAPAINVAKPQENVSCWIFAHYKRLASPSEWFCMKI
jgi:hypothetical protein